MTTNQIGGSVTVRLLRKCFDGLGIFCGRAVHTWLPIYLYLHIQPTRMTRWAANGASNQVFLALNTTCFPVYVPTQRFTGCPKKRKEKKEIKRKSDLELPVFPFAPFPSSAEGTFRVQELETFLSGSLLPLCNNLGDSNAPAFDLLRAFLQRLRRPPECGCNEVRRVYLKENFYPYAC